MNQALTKSLALIGPVVSNFCLPGKLSYSSSRFHIPQFLVELQVVPMYPERLLFRIIKELDPSVCVAQAFDHIVPFKSCLINFEGLFLVVFHTTWFVVHF